MRTGIASFFFAKCHLWNTLVYIFPPASAQGCTHCSGSATIMCRSSIVVLGTCDTNTNTKTSFFQIATPCFWCTWWQGDQRLGWVQNVHPSHPGAGSPHPGKDQFVEQQANLQQPSLSLIWSSHFTWFTRHPLSPTFLSSPWCAIFLLISIFICINSLFSSKAFFTPFFLESFSHRLLYYPFELLLILDSVPQSYCWSCSNPKTLTWSRSLEHSPARSERSALRMDGPIFAVRTIVSANDHHYLEAAWLSSTFCYLKSTFKRKQSWNRCSVIYIYTKWLYSRCSINSSP